MKKVAFMFLVSLFLCLGGCIVRVSSPEQQETTKKEDAVSRTESEHDVQGSLTTLDYVGCEVFNDEYSGELIAFYFDFGNISDENQMFLTTYTVKAFQNGIEMEKSYFDENEYHANSAKDIQPNATARVAVVCEYKDTGTSIQLEVYPWISFDNSKLLEVEVKP